MFNRTEIFSESLTQPFYHHGINKMLRKTLENRFPGKKFVFFLVSNTFLLALHRFDGGTLSHSQVCSHSLWRTKPVCRHWGICRNVPWTFFLSIGWFIKLCPFQIILNKVLSLIALFVDQTSLKVNVEENSASGLDVTHCLSNVL